MHAIEHTRDSVEDTVEERTKTVEQTVACVHEPPTGPARCDPPSPLCGNGQRFRHPDEDPSPGPGYPVSICDPGSGVFEGNDPVSPDPGPTQVASGPTAAVLDLPAEGRSEPVPTLGAAPAERAQAAGGPPPATPGSDPATPWLLAAALVGAPLIFVLYRRLTSDGILDNETRRRVHAAIRDAPGRTAAEVADATVIHYNTVRYHLRLLEEFGEAVARRDGRRIRYFPDHGRLGRLHRRILSAAADDSRHRMLTALARDGPLRSGDLADRLGIAPSTASHHLAKLDEADLVDRTRHENEVHYDLPDRVAGLVERVLG